MTEANDKKVGFGAYLGSMLRFVLSSSIAFALLAGVLILLVGETSMNFEIGLEITPIDGLWVLLGLPSIAAVIFIAVSPLSFYVYRLLVRRRNNGSPNNGG